MQSQGYVAIALMHRPQSSSISYFDRLSTALEDICIPMYSTFVLTGDYNVDVSTHDSLSHNLLNVANQYGLSIIHTNHTHVTSSSVTTIHLVFTSSPTSTKQCETMPPPPPIRSSDHLGILATLYHNLGHPDKSLGGYGDTNMLTMN